MGAWIEIGSRTERRHESRVAPVWGRGLKYSDFERGMAKVRSPPYGGVD